VSIYLYDDCMYHSISRYGTYHNINGMIRIRQASEISREDVEDKLLLLLPSFLSTVTSYRPS
jgi:hypothetical protein